MYDTRKYIETRGSQLTAYFCRADTIKTEKTGEKARIVNHKLYIAKN